MQGRMDMHAEVRAQETGDQVRSLQEIAASVRKTSASSGSSSSGSSSSGSSSGSSSSSSSTSSGSSVSSTSNGPLRPSSAGGRARLRTEILAQGSTESVRAFQEAQAALAASAANDHRMQLEAQRAAAKERQRAVHGVDADNVYNIPRIRRPKRRRRDLDDDDDDDDDSAREDIDDVGGRELEERLMTQKTRKRRTKKADIHPDLAVLIRKGHIAFAEEDYETSMKCFMEGLMYGDDNVDVWRGIKLVAERSGQEEKLLAARYALIMLLPTAQVDFDECVSTGETMMINRQYTTASELFGVARRKQPSNPRAVIGQARCAMALNNHAKAKQKLRSFMNAHGRTPELMALYLNTNQRRTWDEEEVDFLLEVMARCETAEQVDMLVLQALLRAFVAGEEIESVERLTNVIAGISGFHKLKLPLTDRVRLLICMYYASEEQLDDDAEEIFQEFLAVSTEDDSLNVEREYVRNIAEDIGLSVRAESTVEHLLQLDIPATDDAICRRAKSLDRHNCTQTQMLSYLTEALQKVPTAINTCLFAAKYLDERGDTDARFHQTAFHVLTRTLSACQAQWDTKPGGMTAEERELRLRMHLQMSLLFIHTGNARKLIRTALPLICTAAKWDPIFMHPARREARDFQPLQPPSPFPGILEDYANAVAVYDASVSSLSGPKLVSIIGPLTKDGAIDFVVQVIAATNNVAGWNEIGFALFEEVHMSTLFAGASAEDRATCASLGADLARATDHPERALELGVEYLRLCAGLPRSANPRDTETPGADVMREAWEWFADLVAHCEQKQLHVSPTLTSILRKMVRRKASKPIVGVLNTLLALCHMQKQQFRHALKRLAQLCDAPAKGTTQLHLLLSVCFLHVTGMSSLLSPGYVVAEALALFEVYASHRVGVCPAEVWYNAGCVFHQIGLTTLAVVFYQRALSVTLADYAPLQSLVLLTPAQRRERAVEAAAHDDENDLPMVLLVSSTQRQRDAQIRAELEEKVIVSRRNRLTDAQFLAAHNLALIHRMSGNEPAANALIKRYCEITRAFLARHAPKPKTANGDNVDGPIRFAEQEDDDFSESHSNETFSPSESDYDDDDDHHYT